MLCFLHFYVLFRHFYVGIFLLCIEILFTCTDHQYVVVFFTHILDLITFAKGSEENLERGALKCMHKTSFFTIFQLLLLEATNIWCNIQIAWVRTAIVLLRLRRDYQKDLKEWLLIKQLTTCALIDHEIIGDEDHAAHAFCEPYQIQNAQAVKQCAALKKP